MNPLASAETGGRGFCLVTSYTNLPVGQPAASGLSPLLDSVPRGLPVTILIEPPPDVAARTPPGMLGFARHGVEYSLGITATSPPSPKYMISDTEITHFGLVYPDEE
jgi:hypothetical protein